MDIEQKPELRFYVDHVNAYEREAKTWETRSKKIVKRFKDMRPEGSKTSRFNILWSNIQTLHPALYDGAPTPNVDRRFEDDEEVNTTVAQILERSVSYFVKNNDFNDCMDQAVLDRLLPGRGTVWVRYVPNFKDVQITGNEAVKADGSQVTDDINPDDEELYSEDVVLDYVHWQDFGHEVARTWQENRMVWRKVYLGKKEIKARFPDTCEVDGKFLVPMDAKALGKKEDDQSSAATKATIYELWDRVTKKACWFHKDMEGFLDEKDDPLGIEGFYPCPKPVYSTLANDSLIPTPDFILYQDQANELDVLTARIEMLNKALKVVGVYDASAEGVQRMLSENMDNKLIPVEQWAVFAEKGGLKGVVDYFPIDMVAGVLLQLYEAREKTKQDIYEITGISDIIRGATNPNETLGAQELKGKYASIRLDNMQKDVARFSRDCVRIMTEIIAEHFSIETLKEVSGVRLLTQAEKQTLEAQMQPQMGPDGQPVEPPPLPDHLKKMLEKPAWEEIEAVLRESGARCFRIDIETDSTIKADQEAEKAARSEFLSAAGSFIQQAAAIPNPELQPLLMQMLQFGVGGFKVGREMETEFKVAIDAIKAKSEQPPPEDPAVQQAQADMELKQQELQMKQEAAQQDAQLAMEQARVEGQMRQEEAVANFQLKQQEAEAAAQLKMQESQAMLDIKRQESAAMVQMKREEIEANIELEKLRIHADMVKASMTAGHEDGEAAVKEKSEEVSSKLLEVMSQPREFIITRDAKGQMQSVKSK